MGLSGVIYYYKRGMAGKRRVAHERI